VIFVNLPSVKSSQFIDAGTGHRWLQWATILFWLSFTLMLCAYAFKPIFDPDFWWHLKSGQAMLQQGSLLHSDPFSLIADGNTSLRETLILKGYWLWQICVYLSYQWLGFKGIGLFNLVVAAVLGVVIVQQFYQRKISSALAALLTSGGFLVFTLTYQLERPQVISFVFCALLLALLHNFERTGRFDWRLPALMLLWANMHGGFIVGDILLGLFTLGALLEYRSQPQVLKHAALWIGLALLASLANPNGGLAIYAVFKFYNSQLMSGVAEYRSTWVNFSAGGRFVVILWILIGLYWLGVVFSRWRYWPELLVALFLSWFALAHMRNMGLYVPAMLPATGRVLHLSLQRFPSPRRGVAWISLVLVLSGAGLMLSSAAQNWQIRQESGSVQQAYPEKAIEFLQTTGLKGRMFNDYEYGGYLLWKLAPDIKVFIDGRGMDPQIFNDYGKIKSASKKAVNGRKEYEVLLEKYRIDYVIQQVYQGDGSLQPLMNALLAKPDWVPIYQDNFVYILSRRDPKNAEVIDRYQMNKSEFKTRLLLLFSYLVRQFPHEVGYKIARAGILTSRGNLKEAQQQIYEIRVLAPNEKALVPLQRDLIELMGKKPNSQPDAAQN